MLHGCGTILIPADVVWQKVRNMAGKDIAIISCGRIVCDIGRWKITSLGGCDGRKKVSTNKVDCTKVCPEHVVTEASGRWEGCPSHRDSGRLSLSLTEPVI